MELGLRNPPLGWGPLILVAMAHGAGLWAGAAPQMAAPSPPAGIRFALAVVPAHATLPAMAAPAPVPRPEPRPEPKQKIVTAPVRKAAVVVAAAARERSAQPVSRERSAQVAAPSEVVPDTALPVTTTVSAVTPAAEGAQVAAPSASAPSFTADYLNNPKPDYPRISRRLGEEGVVLLIVSVGADGRARAVSVERPSGHDRLDEAALRSVRGWRFAPAQRNGVAVPADVRVPIAFSLKES